MRILGIDPGIGRTGWGIIDVVNSKLKVVAYGCIETEVNGDIASRLYVLHDEITNLIREYQPQELSIEDLFFNNNAKTAMIVGQARGVILLAAAQHAMPIAIYTPLQVKVAVTGYGRAEKGQVGQMVKVLLTLSTIPKPDDTADALAIAITHAFSRKMTVVNSKQKS